jgi:tetratricopeptide (TPR) repeat protein
MVDIWHHLGSLPGAVGHWILSHHTAVFFAVVGYSYLIVGRLIDKRIERWEKRAQDAARMGRYDEALKAYARCTFLVEVSLPVFGLLYREHWRWRIDWLWNEQLGDLFSEVGKHPTAVFFYTRAVLGRLQRDDTTWSYLSVPGALVPGLEISATDASLYERLGRSLIEAGCVEEGIIWLRRAVSAYELNPRAWLLLSKAYQQVGNQKLAEEAQQRVASFSDLSHSDVTG